MQVTHARAGGSIEVMGLMQGRIVADGTLLVVDAFALPVEGTETRVNAQAEGYEYMVQYVQSSQALGRPEHVIGWYHSHPGYGCWLSGIDVQTQMLNQQFQEPFLAVVIDPNRTMAAGKVELGAFRTFPEEYIHPSSTLASDHQHVPMEKIEDFGVHANRYYALEVSYFKTHTDSILLQRAWSHYWSSSLSSSPLLNNRSFSTGLIQDVTAKLKNVTTLNRDQSIHTDLSSICRETCSFAHDQLKGLMSLQVKQTLFQMYRPK